MSPAEVEQEVLERAQGAGVLGAVEVEGPAELGGARLAHAGQAVEGTEVEQALEVGLGDRLAHPIERRHRGEVEQGLGDGGYR